jgi:hypothetical protein
MTQATTADPLLSDADRAALELAIEIDRKRSPGDRQQIDDMLRERPWVEAATFAAHRCQETALHLKPWQCWPPCAVEVGEADTPGLEHRGIAKSALLLRKMLLLGISRWDPDPIAAIAAAETERDRRTG